MRYVSRLHYSGVARPRVLTQVEVDQEFHGQLGQRAILSWQVGTAFAMGVAGTFVFAWTDEWFTGGHLIEDWAFGLGDRDRKPKLAYQAVSAAYRGALPPPLQDNPKVSVVVCAYNAERTMEQCL